MKPTKKEFEVCTNFIDKILEKCKKQADFYTKIAQNNDHSEDFINRMTDLASSFEMISQFVELQANSVLSSLQVEPLGDSTLVGQVEQTAIKTTNACQQTAIENDTGNQSV